MTATTPTIQAIETEYAGHRFRSRLEARWAVCFEALGVRWQYEQQGLDLGDGVRYLPDFLLPDVGVKGLYVEVKGQLDPVGADKILRLAASDRRVALVGDIPAAGCEGPDIHLFDSHEPARLPGAVAIWKASLMPCLRRSISVTPFGWPLVVYDINDPNVALTLPGLIKDRDLSRSPGWVARAPGIAAAYDEARQARFEHGESGAPRSFVRPSQGVAPA